MGKSKGVIAPWLMQNIGKFEGLSWENENEHLFKICWEKQGDPGYEQTLAICKAYCTCGSRSKKNLDDSDVKNRFRESLTKSPYVEIVEACNSVQVGNYLLCKIVNIAEENHSSAMDVDIDRSQPSSSIIGLPFLKNEPLNVYCYSVFYGGDLMAEQYIDFSTGCRLHYGDAESQKQDAMFFGKEEVREDYHLNTIAFPEYNGDDETITKLLLSNHGIVLKSSGGRLEGRRLCQVRIYCSDRNSGIFSKMKRREVTPLFSYDDYALALTQNQRPNEEIVLSFGLKPKPALPVPIRLSLSPILVPKIRNHFGLSVDSSLSRSAEESLERLSLAMPQVTAVVEQCFS